MSRRSRESEIPPGRTPIWAAGSQQPKFDLRAWGFVAQALSRRWLDPRLDRMAAALASGGGQVASGRFRVNVAWLGRASRWVPACGTVGKFIAASGARVSEARAILQPRLPAPEPIAYPNLIRPPLTQPHSGQPEPMRPELTRPALTRPCLTGPDLTRPDLTRPAPVQPTLAQPAPAQQPPAQPPPAQPPPVQPPPVQPPPLQPPTAQPTLTRPTPAPPLDMTAKAATPSPSRLRRLMSRAAAHGIAWGALALTLPVGLVQATLYHLNGGDLAAWQ